MRTIYVVTDNRAFVLEAGGHGAKAESFTPNVLAKMKLKSDADGGGDLIFEDHWNYSLASKQIEHVRRGFFGLENVRDAERVVRNVLSSRGKAG